MKPVRFLLVVLALVLVAAACGGDDDDTAESDVGDGGSGEEVTDGGDGGGDGELALGDPCDLVDATTVSGIVGTDVTGLLTGEGDGFPGAGCLWSDPDGVPVVQVGFTPDGGSFVSANNAGGDEFTDLEGLGDEAFAFADTEIQVSAGGHQIIVTLVGVGLGVDDAGRALAEAAVAAIS